MISLVPAAVSLLYEIHKNDDFRIFGDRKYCHGKLTAIWLRGSDMTTDMTEREGSNPLFFSSRGTLWNRPVFGESGKSFKYRIFRGFLLILFGGNLKRVYPTNIGIYAIKRKNHTSKSLRILPLKEKSKLGGGLSFGCLLSLSIWCLKALDTLHCINTFMLWKCLYTCYDHLNHDNDSCFYKILIILFMLFCL